MKRSVSMGIVWAAAAAMAACSNETVIVNVRHLDRPSDVAFGCVGRVDAPTGDNLGEVLPPAACGLTSAQALDGGLPLADTIGFIAEASRGDVAVAILDSTGSTSPQIMDSDPLVPGVSGIPVGTIPAEIATTPDGCHAVTANTGSCDLGLIDVYRAAFRLGGSASRLAVKVTAGQLAAAPVAIALPPSLPADTEVTCAATATGLAYLAYPECHLVAAVDLATGAIRATVRFPDAADPVIGDAEPACPAECFIEGAATGPASAGGEPVALVTDIDGARLFVALADSPELVAVTLGPDGLFVSLDRLPLEGAGGLTRLAVSPDVPMGQGTQGLGGTRRFVYAIGQDHAIHVADVTPGAALAECETQTDPRYLHDVSNLPLFSCIPIGAYPRREGAVGPGIRLPDGIVPFDVAFVTSNLEVGTPEFPNPTPSRLNGVFAVATGLGPLTSAPRGVGYYINVDDDNYPDTEDSEVPGLVELPLALPHTVRDAISARSETPQSCVADDSISDQARGPVRIQGDPVHPAGFVYNFNAQVDLNVANAEPFTPGQVVPGPVLPALSRVQCDETHAVLDLSALGQAGDLERAKSRERGFPDVAVLPNETWTIAWEGQLTADASIGLRAGAQVTIEGAGLTIRDGAAILCELGAEVGDVVQLLGCGATSECGPGETCFIHPEAPEGILGMCLPVDRAAELAATCRSVLVSERRYTAVQVMQDFVAVVPRPRLLASTPLDGCTETAQCEAIHQKDRAAIGPEAPTYEFTCQPDPARGGPSRCVMTCESKDCDPGSWCDSGVCVLGAVPPPECLAPVQQYQVLAGEAFTVVGSRSGYLHPWIADGTGACVRDPEAGPLRVGRFHTDEPVCAPEDELTTLEPNPCRVDLPDEPVILIEQGGAATPTYRTSYAIRFRNPAFRIDIADVVALARHPDLADIIDDFRYSPLPAGYEFTFRIGGGSFPFAEELGAFLPVRLRNGPDGTLWLLDAGESTAVGAPQGQIIHFGPRIDGRVVLF